MKRYTATPNYAEAANDDNWIVVAAESSDVAVNDLTKLSLGTISAPISSTTTGYYAAQVEDLSHLMKGWSYLVKPTVGPRNNVGVGGPTWQTGEPYAYVSQINGFANGDTLAVLEGLQESQVPYSSTATSSDYPVSEYSHVRNAGLIPTTSVNPDYTDTSFFQPENNLAINSRLQGFDSIDYSDTDYGDTYSDLNGNQQPVIATKNYGSSFVPTPDNIGSGAVGNWYVSASGDDTAQASLIAQLLPDFTTDGQRISSVVIGRDSTVITLNGVNSAFVVGQTVTVVTNGTLTDAAIPSQSDAMAAMGWFGGKIVSVTTYLGNTVLTTDLNDTTIGDNNPLSGSLNYNVAFTGTVTGNNTVTISAFGATTNYGIAQGQNLTFSNSISSITSTASTFTVNTTLNHSLYAGQKVTIAGVTGATYTPYNGTWTILATPSGTSFTVNSAINPGNTSAGNVTSATASQIAVIGKITGNGVGASFILDSTGGPYVYNTAIANGTGISFTSNYTDNNARAFAATITKQTLQVNHNENKYDCQYFTTPYYSTPTTIALGATLSTTGATTQVILFNQSPQSKTLANAATISLVEGDYYQEITLTADVTVLAGGTATATVTSFTPTYAYPAYVTAVCGGDGLSHSRYGKDLIFPIVPTVYKNDPVATFRSMTPTTITETIDGNTYYYGSVPPNTVGNTYYSESPYIVTVDDVSNIAVGDTLTFRKDYNPWFSNYSTDAPPPSWIYWSGKQGDPVPWSWTLTDGGGSGFTCTLGATFITLPDANGYSLPLVIGMAVYGADPIVSNGTFVTGWTANQIFLSANTKLLQASAVNLRFYPGKSGFNYWRVQSVNTANNTFVIYGSSADYAFLNSAYANNDTQNYIYAYDNHFYAGNTLDISNATGKGAGVVGLYATTSTVLDNGPEGSLGWHSTNTVIGSYKTGPRYVGSQSVGDQETITPFQIGTSIGSTLALDIIAQNSNAIAVSPLPNTAVGGTYYPTTVDTNQYGNTTYINGAWSGFADITLSSAYSTNYAQQNQFPIVVGQGETQEIVLVTKSTNSDNGRVVPTSVDGSNSLNVPMLWSLVSGQSFQYDHSAGEPVCTPNFVYNTASTINHAKGTPVVGTPDFGTVYSSTTGPNYKAAAALVAQNTTQNLTINADTQMNVTSPWLASGNQGQPNLSTTLASPATSNSSTLSIVSANGFPDTYPSVYQSGIYYLPPMLGRLAGDISSGISAIPFVPNNDLPRKFPFFVRLGSEILQVSSVTEVVAGSTTYSSLNTATATTSAHGDFTPIHLNSLSTDVQYTTLDVPTFYLADAVVSGTLSGTSNTIQGLVPATLGTGQTITGGGLGTGVGVSSYTSNLITISTTFPAATSGSTFTNSATFAMAVYPGLLTSFTNVTSAAGGTNTTFASIPNVGSALTGTGLAASKYISGLDTKRLRLAVNNNPTSYTTGATFTSTLTFTCSTTSGSRYLTIKNITVNGTSYPKYGATNPTWNGKTMDYYLKVGAPITTTTGGGIASKYIASVQVSAGTVYLSAAATATATATVTSVITMTANTGRAVTFTPNTSSEINKLLVANSTIADSAGATAYITTGTTIATTFALSSTQTEVWMSAPTGTTGAWSRTASLSTTFNGSSGFSNLITGVANAATLYQVGSLVYGNPYIPDNTTVTGISGTTLTLSNQTTNAFTPVGGTSFKIGSSLNVGKTYTSLPVSPLPCQLPNGTSLYLTFGNYIQQVSISATAAAGATNISVTPFQPNYNFSTTSYYYGVAQTSTGGYGYGANITVGLVSDLYPNQAIILQANSDTSLTNVITVAEYTRKSARTIVIKPFTSTYAYDGQAVGYSLTGDFTIGSNQIVNASATAGLSVGQQVFSTYLSSNIQYFITAISGSTITLTDVAASTGTTQAFKVYATTFITSLPMTLDNGTNQEIVYPISLPLAAGGFWNVSLAEPTMYAHNNNTPFVYYQWPNPLNVGDTTYRADFKKFFMWDGYQWRSARAKSVRAVYTMMGAVGGGDVTNITLLDPSTGKESAPDTFSGVPSTGFNTYYGGERSADPNGSEWTGDTLAAIQLHIKTKVPQGKSVAFRSLALEATYVSAPSVSSVHFSPGDNFEISPDLTNSVFWYYSDLDNASQSGYQVKIYDDYTYNRPDFSPDDNTIIPFWSTTGNDNTLEVEITATTGWVNGQRYWAFVRVAKQWQAEQWWGDWFSKSFSVTIDQPSIPIISVYTDNTNSVNNLAIQSTDNLIGTNNSSFGGGLGNWVKGANDTASTSVTSFIDGIPLGATLTTSGQITSLPIGSTGYVKTTGGTSALGSTNGTGTFVVSGNSALNTDALGFPTSGTFWVTIGSENILVKNLMDGNNTGDTFQIVTRGYKNPNTGVSTTPATHSVGDQVLYGLQNPLYVGTTATIDWKHQNVVDWNTTSSALVRWSNGQAAYNEPAGRQPLTIVTQTQGSDKDVTDHVTVLDPTHLLSQKDVGSTVVVCLQHWHYAASTNKLTYNSTGVATVVEQVGKKILTGAHPQEAEMKIKGIRDVWDDTANKQGKIQIATTFRQISGSKKQPCSHLTVVPSVAKTQKFSFESSNACVSLDHLPAGTRLTIHANSIQDPIKNVTLPAADVTVTLTQSYYPKDNVLHIAPIITAAGFKVGDGSCFIIPQNATITWSPPVVFTGKKVIHFTGKYTDKKGFKAQRLQLGDILYVTKGRTATAVKAAASGSYTKTTVTANTKMVNVDSQQSFVVDFLTAPTTSTGGVLGTLTGTTFTKGTSATQYNAIAFAASPGSVTGAYVSTTGLSPTATVRALTTVVGGTYAAYTAVTFNDNTGTATNVTVQNSSATGSTGSTPSTPILDGIYATFLPSANLVIAAGLQSIPVTPSVPKYPFPENTVVSFHYPAIFGDNVLAVDPTVDGTAEISTLPSSGFGTGTSLANVNAGQLYALAAFSKVVVGAGNPVFTPRIDWYDANGNLLKSSDGTASLGGNGHTIGSTNSVAIGITLNSTASPWGRGWYPTAMVATAPQNLLLGTSTGFTGTVNAGTGTFTIGGTGMKVALIAGSAITNTDGVTFTTTTSTAVGATQLPVRFVAGIAFSSTTSFYANAAFAATVFQWTSAKATDAYALSGVMLKALNAPSLGSNSTSSSEMPTLTTAATVGATNSIGNAVVLPSTTPVGGVNSLYIFDPVGDFGTTELHLGTDLNVLWTNTTSAVAVGATQVSLTSVVGLAAGSPITLEYGGGNQETVYVDSSWSGSSTVAIASPYFTMAHAKGVRAYSPTAGLASEIVTTQAVNTPVAVLNWGVDGYIPAQNSTYQYKVEKSEDGGNTWTTLRHGSALKADDTGVAYITDYEAVPGLTTSYRATATHVADPNATDYTVAGAPSNQLVANTVSNQNWWLASTSDDSLRYPMLVKTGYSETTKHPAGVFYPLGSSRPITLAGTPTGRDGSLTVTWTDLANFDNFLSLLNKGETLVLTNPVESDRKYIFINQDVSITHNAANSPYREISINYVEAAPPTFGYTYGS